MDTHLGGRFPSGGPFPVGGFMSEQREPSSPEPGPLRQGRAARASFFRSPFIFFSLCALTFIASSLALSGLYLQDMALWVSGKVQLVHMLLALSPTLWVACVLAVLHEWRDSFTPGEATGRQRLEAGVCVVLAALMLLLPILLPYLTAPSLVSGLLERAQELISLPDFFTKFLVMNLLGVAVVTLLIAGMFAVHLQLVGQLRQSPSRQEEPEAERVAEEVRRYQQLRSRLELFRGLTAANIGIVILNSGAIRNLLNESAPGQPELLPAGSVVVFGIYYTWVLAIIYLPIRKSLTEVGQVLAERLVRQSLVGRVTWKQWFEEQQVVRTYLGLHGSALQDIQQGLSVLAPLLASISSLALGSQG